MAAAKGPPSHRVGRRVRFSLFLALVILALARAAAWGLTPLPENWNIRGVARIEASAPTSPSLLTFAVLGDSRDSHGVFVRLLKQVAADPGLAFAIHLGDMVAFGSEADFRVFFQQVQEYLPISLLGVAGNHDLKNGGSRLWERVFGPRCYSFQVQGHCFLVLDYNPQSLDEAQWNWLTRELAKAQGGKSRLVFMHQPLFDPRDGPHPHALPPEMGQKLASLFQQYRVTHIFAGHIHGYFTGQWSGVPFTISGGGGARLAGTAPYHYFYHYLKVELPESGVRIKVQRLSMAPRAGKLGPEIHGN